MNLIYAHLEYYVYHCGTLLHMLCIGTPLNEVKGRILDNNM